MEQGVHPQENGDGLRVLIKLRLAKRAVFFGPGVAQLLGLVGQTGSLHAAAGRMDMAYSKAWKIVRAAEHELGFTLTERRVGGKSGGGSVLTPEGEAFLTKYQKFQQESEALISGVFKKYFGDMKNGKAL